jgi:hypothetical protein
MRQFPHGTPSALLALVRPVTLTNATRALDGEAQRAPRVEGSALPAWNARPVTAGKTARIALLRDPLENDAARETVAAAPR